MSDANKKSGKQGSKAGVLLLALVAVVGGVAALGYFKPDTPYIGPFMAGLFKTAQQATSGSGTYEVRIGELMLDADEFKDGDELDLQVLVFKADADGKIQGEPLIDTNKWGTNIRKVGKDRLAKTWSDQPVNLDWSVGVRYAVEVWTKKGGNRKLAEWVSAPDPKGFPLSEIYFAKLDGRDVKNAKGNYVKFTAKAAGSK